MAGLLTQGRSSFAEVSLLANDPLFQKALNLERVYAPETVRIYLDRWAEKGNEKLYEHVLALLGQSNLNLIKSVSLSRIGTKNGNYVPVDIDVSPMDNSNTKKEAVGWTYRRLMDQLRCAMVEPGGIGLMVIGRGKRKSIESVTKAYRKGCERKSKEIYSVPNRVDASEEGAKLLFLDISRA